MSNFTTKQAIVAEYLADPAGPYSAAVRWGGLLFLSGQVPRDQATGAILGGSIAEQTSSVLHDIGRLLTAAGSHFRDVLKVTVFLTDMADFDSMNEVYGTFFPQPYPARSTVAVSALPLGARMELEVVAVAGKGARS